MSVQRDNGRQKRVQICLMEHTDLVSASYLPTYLTTSLRSYDMPEILLEHGKISQPWVAAGAPQKQEIRLLPSLEMNRSLLTRRLLGHTSLH